MKTFNRNERGFTSTELVIVIFMLGIAFTVIGVIGHFIIKFW